MNEPIVSVPSTFDTAVIDEEFQEFMLYSAREIVKLFGISSLVMEHPQEHNIVESSLVTMQENRLLLLGERKS